MKVGLLHPGKMGTALAACVEGEVLWASEGRSDETAARASRAEMVDLGSLASLVTAADVIISVCPPAAAMDVARQVSRLGFHGLYVDVNAVAPATARQIGDLFGRFVDGGIIGPPPSSDAARSTRGRGSKTSASQSSGTRLYLSGGQAHEVAQLLIGSPVDTHVLGPEPGRASALKMAYAAWTKGTAALLLSIAALATSEAVIEELLDEWDISIPELRRRLELVSSRVGEKAWRFAGEMEEIARSFGNAGLPDGFHLAAADLYTQLADLKDRPTGQTPGEISRRLLGDRGHDDLVR